MLTANRVQSGHSELNLFSRDAPLSFGVSGAGDSLSQDLTEACMFEIAC